MILKITVLEQCSDYDSHVSKTKPICQNMSVDADFFFFFSDFIPGRKKSEHMSLIFFKNLPFCHVHLILSGCYGN